MDRYCYRDCVGDPSIKAFTSRFITFGIAASSQTSAGVKINGIDPDSENLVTGLGNKIHSGEYLLSTDKNKAIVSNKLGAKLGLKLRSKIVLTFQSTEGNIASGAFRVVAFYETYNSTYDQLNVFVRGQDLARLLAVEGVGHEIAALVHEPDSLDHLLQVYRDNYPAIAFEDWKEISPELGLMVESFDQYMIIFLAIILLAVLFGIINTMLMAVLERVREIGMLMAIGMNKYRIFYMIALETIYLVLISAPFGLLFAYLTIFYTGNQGIDLSGLYAESYASFGVKTIIYPKLTTEYYWQIIAMVMITAVLAAIYPAYTAIKLDPVQAMRKI